MQLIILKKVVTYSKSSVYLPATAGKGPVFGQPFLTQPFPLPEQFSRRFWVFP